MAAALMAATPIAYDLFLFWWRASPPGPTSREGTMANINFAHVRKAYGPFEAIKDFNLEVNDGEFCVFVGPSGCGKSTADEIVPPLVASSPASIFSAVDLPQPDGPTRTQNSPSSTSR